MLRTPQGGLDLLDQFTAGGEFDAVPEHLADTPSKEPANVDTGGDAAGDPVRLKATLQPARNGLVCARVADRRRVVGADGHSPPGRRRRAH